MISGLPVAETIAILTEGMTLEPGDVIATGTPAGVGHARKPPVWMKHGAIDYKECVGEDLENKWGTTFSRMMKLKPGETVIFSWIVYKSRAHRDRVNAKVMAAMPSRGGPEEMPLDMKRVVYGGFNVSVGG